MAPELRKRKVAVEAPKANGTPKAVAKTATKGKRKAADDASPISLKKQKPVKQTKEDGVEKPEKPAKATPKKTAKTSTPKKPAKEAEAVEEEESFIAAPEESDSEDEQNDNALALAAQVDPEDDDGATSGAVYKTGQDVGKVPDVADAVRDSAKSFKSDDPGVVYIGRIPHGFYEYEMKQYFGQFGKVSRMRIARNKKTGASKHFAFIEFEDASTAEIVGKTMDNYLLFGHLLKCKVIPKDDVQEHLFKGANRRFKKIPWNKMEGKKLEKPLTESTWQAKVAREKVARAKKAAKLKEIGYEFEALELSEVPTPAVVEVAEEVKVIEAPPAAEDAEASEEAPVEEVETEVKLISAPKLKAAKKGAKATKAKKAKA